MGIRPKLTLLLIAVSVIPTLFIGVVTINISQKQLIKNISQKNTEFSHQTEEKINSYLYERYKDSLLWSKNSFIISSIKEKKNIFLPDFFNDELSLREYFHFIIALNSKGELSYSNNPNAFDPYLIKNDHFKKALSGTPAIHDVFFYDPIKDHILLFYLPIKEFSSSKKTLGVLITALKWQNVVNMITSIKIMGKNSTLLDHVMITKANGLIIACFDKSEVFKENLIELGMDSAVLASQGKEGNIIEMTEHQNKSLTSYSYFKPYKEMPQTNWLLLIEQDFDRITQPLKTLKRIILLVIFIFTMLLFSASYTIARKITAPLQKMAEITKEIGSGNLDKRIAFKSKDEVGQLIESFNKMAENLSVYRKDLLFSQKYNENIIMTMKDALIVISSDGITFANPAALTLFGYQETELVGSRPEFLIYWQKPSLKNEWLNDLIENEFTKDTEFNFKTKEGTLIPALITSSLLVMPEENPEKLFLHKTIQDTSELDQSLRIILIAKDIREQKKTFLELQTAKEKAEEASRLKGEFLSNMSHELRTPMNGIVGMAQLLMESDSLSEEEQKYLDIIMQSSDNLLTLISNILDLSKFQNDKTELNEQSFSVKELLIEKISRINKFAEKKEISIDYTIDESIPDILMGDSLKLKQVLFNILDNSIKFTDQGQIQINLEKTSALPGKFNKEDYIQLLFSIKDTGAGIPSDQKKIIFDAFSQADSSTTRSYQGVGLGLTIAKMIIDKMHGKIWFESKVNQGTTFNFTVVLKKIS